MCHSRTKNLKEVVREADIIIAALGQAEFVTADMVKDGAVIVDVGRAQVQLHHPGTGRRRSDDDHLTDEKHAESGPQRSLQRLTSSGIPAHRFGTGHAEDS